MIDLKSRMIKGLRNIIPGVQFNGSSENIKNSLYSLLSVSLPPSDKNEMILFQLDLKNIAASGGSACGSGALKGSHVINALKTDEDRSTIRFSFSMLLYVSLNTELYFSHSEALGSIITIFFIQNFLPEHFF